MVIRKSAASGASTKRTRVSRAGSVSKGGSGSKSGAAKAAAVSKAAQRRRTSGSATKRNGNVGSTRRSVDPISGDEGGVKPVKVPRLPKAVATAIEAARNKKALDTVVLDLRKADGFTDYFVICSASNARQIAAIADAVRDTLKEELGERPAVAEGAKASEWVLLDYFNFVVHIFSRECRSFYDLERLWGNADRYEFSDERA
jgi:ribosome-associated protein